MAGSISIAGNCISGQWSAARRPKSSSRGSAVTKSTTLTSTGGEFARPTRSFLCRPISLIRRPRGGSGPKKTTSAVPERTKDTPGPAESIKQVEERVPPAPTSPLPPAAVVSKPASDTPAIPDTGDISKTPAFPRPPVAAVSKPAPDIPAIHDTGDIPAAPAPDTKETAASYGKVPPYFIRNDGQLDQTVRYYVKGPRGTVYLTNTEVVFDFLQENPSEEGEDEEEMEEPRRLDPEREEKKTFTRLVFRQQFKSPNPEVQVDGNKELLGKINYFVGGKSNWHSNIPTVEEVFYHDLYPGIDLNCFFEGANIRYHYTVNPGADPGLLIFQYVGIDGLEVKPSGDLIVLTPFGGFVTPAPKITQEMDGKEEEIEGGFIIQDDTTVTYEIGPYNKQYPLTIK